MSKTIRELDFRVPIRTVSEMNCRDHWRVRLKRKQDQQLEMITVLHNNLRGRIVELPCAVTLTRIGPRKLDGDNLQSSLKFCRDAIAKKLGVDDGSPEINWQYAQMPTGSRDYAVKVEISSRTNSQE